MIRETRRSLLKRSLAGMAGVSLGAANRIEPETTRESRLLQSAELRFIPAELAAMREVATAFMEKHKVPGLSVAIAKDDRLLYVEGFGWANEAAKQKATPGHLFRIASISKPITATTIFSLIENGKLKQSDRVFGPDAILGTDYGAPPYKEHVADLTVDHLLTHTAGGWQNDGSDPMFSHPEMNQRQLITHAIANQALTHVPGTHYAYSNFGFCILGRVIEKATGKPYEEAVRTIVLNRCGIRNMRIGGSRRNQRLPNEVVYYDQEPEAPYGMNVPRMDSHGGWVASAIDLVRFVVRIDDFAPKADILRSSTIHSMMTPTSANANYARGWCVNASNNWWHTGSIPGTSTILVRTSGGFGWAALCNVRNEGIDGDLDRMMWNMVGKISEWPQGDLFRQT